MKKVKLTLLLSIVSAALFTGQAQAYSVDINDNYIGTGNTGSNSTFRSYENSDVIGDSKIFDIQKMVVNFSNSNRLSSISVHTNYVKPLTDVGASGTVLGDMFISTNGYKTTDMRNDNMNNGEKWEYALVLSAHDFDSELPGTRTINLFKVASDGSNIKRTYAPNGYIFREYQETLINTSKGNNLGVIGTWNINNTGANPDGGILSFELTDTRLVDQYLSATDYGFHWNMTCGNDTIEGGAAAPVPEPSTIFLLGAGLLGAGLIRRKPRM